MTAAVVLGEVRRSKRREKGGADVVIGLPLTVSDSEGRERVVLSENEIGFSILG